jgi:hypothetical protein
MINNNYPNDLEDEEDYNDKSENTNESYYACNSSLWIEGNFLGNNKTSNDDEEEYTDKD